MISVIINVFNDEKHLGKCIESVVNQTYKDLEIIIVNDGSTDNTLAICESYSDDRIRIISQNNKGLAFSRNVGIDNSNGEYLYFIDSDDFIEPDTLEYLYNLSQKYNADFTTCKVMTIHNYDFKKENNEEKVEILSNKEMLGKILLRKDRATETWNKLMKRELFDNLRFEDRIINDMAFSHKLVMRTDNIVFGNQVKYYYVKHSQSITARKSSLERLIDIYKVFVDRYFYVEKVYPKFAENEYALLEIIVRLYLKNNKELEKYLNEKNAVELFNKHFSFRFLKCKVRINEKIKILLFRINPKLNRLIVDIYLKIKKLICSDK